MAKSLQVKMVLPSRSGYKTMTCVVVQVLEDSKETCTWQNLNRRLKDLVKPLLDQLEKSQQLGKYQGYTHFSIVIQRLQENTEIPMFDLLTADCFKAHRDHMVVTGHSVFPHGKWAQVVVTPYQKAQPERTVRLVEPGAEAGSDSDEEERYTRNEQYNLSDEDQQRLEQSNRQLQQRCGDKVELINPMVIQCRLGAKTHYQRLAAKFTVSAFWAKNGHWNVKTCGKVKWEREVTERKIREGMADTEEYKELERAQAALVAAEAQVTVEEAKIEAEDAKRGLDMELDEGGDETKELHEAKKAVQACQIAVNEAKSALATWRGKRRHQLTPARTNFFSKRQKTKRQEKKQEEKKQ